MEASKEVKFSDEVTVVFHASQNPSSLPATRVARTIPTERHDDSDQAYHNSSPADKEEVVAPGSRGDLTDVSSRGPLAEAGDDEGGDRDSVERAPRTGPLSAEKTMGGGQEGVPQQAENAAAPPPQPPNPPANSPPPPASSSSPSTAAAGGGPAAHGLKDPPPTSAPLPKSAPQTQTPQPKPMGQSAAARADADPPDPASLSTPSPEEAVESSIFDAYVAEGESIDDARQRLRTAIHQTKRLCHAFTERVYSKYRVCLRPVTDAPNVLERIQRDPREYHRHVSHQMQLVRDEKEAEKKEAAKLQAELAAVTAATPSFELATSAEQLLYFTAGLNLIVLPEDDLEPSLAARYPDRGPFSSGGERARGISQAAAAAGEVMLDRARKAAALRAERLRQNPPQQPTTAGGAPSLSMDLLAAPATGAAAATVKGSIEITTTGEGSVVGADSLGAPSATAARLAAPSTVSRKPLPGGAPGKGAGKSGGASRAAASRTNQSSVAAASAALTTGALLSVAPLADQIVVAPAHSKLAASTSALLARSCVVKSTQQRLKHPYPESMGGRRRANSSKKEDVFLQAYLALTLPPLPSTRERLERKPLSVSTHPTERAVTAVKGILQLFDSGKPTTKIRILNGMRQLSESAQAQSPAPSTGDVGSTGSSPISHPADPPIDPVVTFSVLHAVGLVRVCETSAGSSPPQEPQNRLPAFDSPVWSERVKSLHSKLRRQPLSERILQSSSGNEAPTTRTPTGDASRQKNDLRQQVPAESIRGGGDSSESPSEDVAEKAEPKHNEGESVRDNHDGKPDTSSGAASQDKSAGKRKYSDPSYYGQKHPPSKRKNSDPGSSVALAAASAPPAAPEPDTPLSQQSQLLSSQLTAVSQFGGAYSHSTALNAFHLANQLRSIQHPPGELAEYIGTLHQRTAGYELSSLMQQASNPSSLAGLGLVQPGVGLVGFDGTRLFARDQQAAALLSSTAFPQATSPYAHVTPYPAAVSALLGSSTLMHGHGPYSLSGSQMHAPKQSPDVQRTGGTQTAPDLKPVATATAESNAKPPPDRVVNSKTALPTKGNATSQSSADEQPASRPAQRVEQQEGRETPSLGGAPGDSTRQAPPQGTSTTLASYPKAATQSATTSRPSATLPMKNSDQIKEGKFDLAVAELSEEAKLLALDFLAAAAAIVPIPKSLVSSSLKDKLNNAGLKLPSGGAVNLPRDVIISAVLVWLWANHEKDFQDAFDKSGRFDVDPGCNWLIHTVNETCVRAIAQDIADCVARNQGPYSEAPASRKSHTGSKNPGGQDAEPANPDSAKKLEWHVASLVHKSLSAELQIDPSLDETIPQFLEHVDLLDEARLCALRVKAQERVMLATLISRKATMSESFAHAYVSAMVRAGEALGHENLFEAVQDTETNTSSLLPYDILTAEGDLWEEPCKPHGGFTPGLTGEDLVRRAHARAIIQKSLYKLQERNQIRGGAHGSGPFVDSSNPGGSAASATAGTSAVSPRVGSKRKAAAFGETHVPAGTGSARAKTWAVYDPNHYSVPLEWMSDHSENMPYGLHRVGERLRSLSLSLSARSGEPRSIKKAKRSSSFSGAAAVPSATAGVSATVGEKVKPDEGLPKSTREINWTDIAGIFQSVELPKKSPLNKSGDRGMVGERSKVGGESSSNKTIYAPYCREIDPAAPPDDENDSESEREEDLSDEAFLARHQVVLDAMKAKHTAFLEARKKQLVERRKSKSNK